MNPVNQTQNTETVFLSQQNMGIYELKKGSLQASNRESLSKELSNQYSRSILEIFVVCTATTIADQFTNKNTIWATIRDVASKSWKIDSRKIKRVTFIENWSRYNWIFDYNLKI